MSRDEEADMFVRERWWYQGKQVIDGQLCYVWQNWLPEPDPVTGWVKRGYAHPVSTFWPRRYCNRCGSVFPAEHRCGRGTR